MSNETKKEIKLFDKIKNNDIYVRVFKNPLTYVGAGILLAFLQTVTLGATGDPWGVSGVMAYWGAWGYELLGGSVDKWYYFSSEGAQKVLNAGILEHASSWRNIGVIFGAFAATLLASGFKVKKLKSKKQFFAAAIGGLMMGYGARLAYGCNIGALYSGITSLSVSGWVFAVGMFFGAIVGSKLLMKYLM